MTLTFPCSDALIVAGWPSAASKRSAITTCSPLVPQPDHPRALCGQPGKCPENLRSCWAFTATWSPDPSRLLQLQVCLRVSLPLRARNGMPILHAQPRTHTSQLCGSVDRPAHSYGSWCTCKSRKLLPCTAVDGLRSASPGKPGKALSPTKTVGASPFGSGGGVHLPAWAAVEVSSATQSVHAFCRQACACMCARAIAPLLPNSMDGFMRG